jgi:sterol desaturase/sphingolipid hydroxylase (fatty acid hydroxylase superfamily)
MNPRLAALLLLLSLLALGEGLVRQFVLRRAYDWRAAAASFGDALGRRLLDGAALGAVLPLLGWVWAHRLTTIALDGAVPIAALFIAEELAYYAYHRCAHRVRWFWATHAVHHSPNELTLATALRLGWTGRITGTSLFFATLVWIGFAPQAVAAALALNLLYQFWLHATWIPKLGPLEWLLNTPTHHRVHHGSNPEYLDCNYGGVVIIFDRLFGSFVAERADLPPRYGLVTPLATNNPLKIAFHEWLNLARDLRQVRSPGQALKTLFGPPR